MLREVIQDNKHLKSEVLELQEQLSAVQNQVFELERLVCQVPQAFATFGGEVCEHNSEDTEEMYYQPSQQSGGYWTAYGADSS